MSNGKYTFLNLATKVLERADRPLTPKQIWQKAEEAGFDKKLNSKGKTPVASVSSNLYTNVQGEKAIFIKKGNNPAYFFLKAREGEMPNEERWEALEETASNKKEKSTWKEKDLYPLLTHYVSTNPSFGQGKTIYTKAIAHEESQKKGYSGWVYPDMVGCYLPINDLESEILDLATCLVIICCVYILSR